MPAIPDDPVMGSYWMQPSVYRVRGEVVHLWRIVAKSDDGVELRREDIPLSSIRLTHEALADSYVEITIPQRAITDALAADPSLADPFRDRGREAAAARTEAMLAGGEADLRRDIGELQRDVADLRRERDALAVDLEQAKIDRKAAVDRYNEQQRAHEQDRADLIAFRDDHWRIKDLGDRLILLRRLVRAYADEQDSRAVARRLAGMITQTYHAQPEIATLLAATPENHECSEDVF